MTGKRYLLLGASGMLGRAWNELLRNHGFETTAPTPAQLDLADRNSIEREVTRGIDVVVNCAAWTDVDGAEAHEDEATRLNGEAVGWLAERCREVNTTLVHYSTDYVFNGQAVAPYQTTHELDPVNAYGRSKASGERAIIDSGCRHLIVRSSWLYAPWGKNFVLQIAKLARERDSLRVVDDQRGRPTSAEPLAAASLALAETGARGIFHVTDLGECSWYEFASVIAAQVNPDCQVAPCTSAEYPRPAVRPRYSVLDLDQTEALIGRLSSWQDNLRQVLARLEC
jgi:dTDP-4-dehydrorhamnose reductase